MLSTHYRAASESEFWCRYFDVNGATPDQIPWDHPTELSREEIQCIQGSIQQFQLGEGSTGSRLLKRGLAYSRATGDPEFASALSSFVKEEQRHSAYLLRFMQREGIPAISSHWVDTVFRRLRVLAGLELSLRVLVSAEIVGVAYYRALRVATRSTLLQAICARILQDEAAHLRYQASMLSRLTVRRTSFVHRMVSRIHRMFLLVTCYVVWCGHGRMFCTAGYSRQKFLSEALWEFNCIEDVVCSRMVRSDSCKGPGGTRAFRTW